MYLPSKCASQTINLVSMNVHLQTLHQYVQVNMLLLLPNALCINKSNKHDGSRI